MCDGDQALVVRDNSLIKTAKRNMKNIVPLYYEMKNAEPTQLNKDTIFEGMLVAYTTGNIGPYSNNISKIWNSGSVGEQELNAIKWLCMENNFVIDQCKTLYMPTRPKKVDKIIKSYTKSRLPNFFIYAKNKMAEQVELPTQSTMCRLAEKIPTGRIRYCKTLSNFDYKKLMSGKFDIPLAERNRIVEVYDYWSKRRNGLFNHSTEGKRNEEELYVFQEIRKRIVAEIGKPVDYVVDALVEFLYNERKSSKKQMLWGCFGKELNNNLDTNLKDAKPICPVCGARFEKEINVQVCCSAKCGTIRDNQKRADRHSR